VLYVRSVPDQCASRFSRVISSDTGIPLVALQTSNVWGNVVTALILFLSPEGGLSRPEQSAVEVEAAQDADEIGGVHCGVYEHCRHGEAASVFVNLVNSTGTNQNVK